MYSINITLITDVFFRHFNFESTGYNKVLV